MLKSSGLKIPGRGPKHSSPVGRTSGGGTSSPVVPKDSKLLPPSDPVENIRNVFLPVISTHHRKQLEPFICVNDSVEHSCIRLHAHGSWEVFFFNFIFQCVYEDLQCNFFFLVGFQQFGWMPHSPFQIIYIFI